MSLANWGWLVDATADSQFNWILITTRVEENEQNSVSVKEERERGEINKLVG